MIRQTTASFRSRSPAICRPSSQQRRLSFPNTVVLLLLDLHCQTQLSVFQLHCTLSIAPFSSRKYRISQDRHPPRARRTCPLRPVAADTLLRPELWVLWDHCDCRTDSYRNFSGLQFPRAALDHSHESFHQLPTVIATPPQCSHTRKQKGGGTS